MASAACVAALLVLVSPAPALSQTCIARPGTAALDQYCETIPAGTGERATRSNGNDLRGALTPDQVRRLERHGAEGRAVLALAQGPAPKAKPRPLTSRPPTAAAPRTETDAPPDAPSSNPLAAGFSAIGLAGSLGWALVTALAALAVIAAAGAWASSRRGRRAPP